MKSGKWSIQTRWLHLGMAITVSLQLAISLIMEAPDEKSATPLARAAFEAHEVVGITAFVIVLMHWMWSVAKRADGGLSHLFPWTGPAWAEVKSDVGSLMKRRLPDYGPRGGLPGLVHGLGLLAVTAMALTGATLFFIFPETGKPSDIVEGVASVHEFISTFVWIYWGGHVGLALLHHWTGHDTLRAMFRLKP